MYFCCNSKPYNVPLLFSVMAFFSINIKHIFFCCFLLIPIPFFSASFFPFLVFQHRIYFCMNSERTELNAFFSRTFLTDLLYVYTKQYTMKNESCKKCKCNCDLVETWNELHISYYFPIFCFLLPVYFQPFVVIEHWKMAFQPQLITIIWMLNGVIKATNENIIHKWWGKSKLLVHSSTYV